MIGTIKSPINNIDAPLVGSNSNPSLNVSNQDEASQLPRVETMKFSNALIGNLALKSLQNKVEDFSAQDLLQIQEIPESALKYNSASNFSMGLKVGALLYLPTKKVGYQAGIIAAYKLKRNLSIGLEGTYNVKRNDFSNSEQSSTTRYSFGKEEVSYFLKPTEIHNVEIPLYLKYSFGYPKALDLNASKQERYLKHAVHAGFGVNLFNRVEAEVFEQKENQLLNSIEQGSLSQEYINSSNFNLLMGYEYFFKKSFSIGIRTKYQLNDLYKNTIPNQDGIEPSKLSIELNANIKLF